MWNKKHFSSIFKGFQLPISFSLLYPGLFPGWFLLVLGIWIQITFKFKFYRIKLLQKYFSRKIQMQAQWWHIMFLTPSHLGWSKTVLKLWKKLYFWNWNILPKIANGISYQSWCLHLVPITLSQRESNWAYNPISSYWISLKLINCSWCIYCPNLVASGRSGVGMVILMICHVNVWENWTPCFDQKCWSNRFVKSKINRQRDIFGQGHFLTFSHRSNNDYMNINIFLPNQSYWSLSMYNQEYHISNI